MFTDKSSKTCLLLFSIVTFSFAETNLSSFLDELYNTHKGQIHSMYQRFIQKKLEKYAIDSGGQEVREHLFRLTFYHMLFTSTDAVNCSKGGILEIPYFWHWVEPNPRYSIRYIPDSMPLVKTVPPKGFEKYKSFADIDRTPAIYLKNLVTDSALFSHPDCGDIFTFGWCSEREMAFSCLMTVSGYNAKVKQAGIHVWTEILIDVKPAQGSGCLIVKIDNTFNSIDCEILKDSPSAWKKEFGEGAQVAWYNKKALSENELTAVKNIITSETAKKRIGRKVTEYLY